MSTKSATSVIAPLVLLSCLVLCRHSAAIDIGVEPGTTVGLDVEQEPICYLLPPTDTEALTIQQLTWRIVGVNCMKPEFGVVEDTTHMPVTPLLAGNMQIEVSPHDITSKHAEYAARPRRSSSF